MRQTYSFSRSPRLSFSFGCLRGFAFFTYVSSQALVYFGGTARYVQLPYESHSYLGIETTLDMLHETGAWLDTYVKNAKPRKQPKEKDKRGEREKE